MQIHHKYTWLPFIGYLLFVCTCAYMPPQGLVATFLSFFIIFFILCMIILYSMIIYSYENDKKKGKNEILLQVRVYASVVLFIFSPILLSMNCHSDCDTIDDRIAGNRRPYPGIFQRFIKSPRVYELCQPHFL